MMGLSCFMTSLFLIFPFCYYSTQNTEELLAIGDKTYSGQWYRFPARLQLSVALLIQQSQRPKVFTGFDMVECSLQHLKR